MAQAEAAGIVFTQSATDADTIIINTCGFIADAKEESINETLAAIAEKESGRVQKIFVMGCLPELYRTELQTELPEVDRFFGTRELPAVLNAIGASYRIELHDHRSITPPNHASFLKILRRVQPKLCILLHPPDSWPIHQPTSRPAPSRSPPPAGKWGP